jgi:hypothetical protein
MAGESGVPGLIWQLKDRSESGCRLRGRIGNSDRVLPGSLIAFREHADNPWILALVRRLRKRIGDRIDIGIEYIGESPVLVNLAVDDDRAARPGAASDRVRRHCFALHLQENSGHPHLPFKTLILSSREFNTGLCLSLRSDGAEYTVRLKEPIEEQDRFVWLPYELVFRLASDGRIQSQSSRGRLAIAPRPKRPSPAARPTVAARSAVLAAFRRMGGARKA